uniref:Uncharacterized protein n=1 Tax=Chlorobium phaeobacteroides (strain BS1) TaxID=331678 RepID=B3EMQ1_CHLPB
MCGRSPPAKRNAGEEATSRIQSREKVSFGLEGMRTRAKTDKTCCFIALLHQSYYEHPPLGIVLCEVLGRIIFDRYFFVFSGFIIGSSLFLPGSAISGRAERDPEIC